MDANKEKLTKKRYTFITAMVLLVGLIGAFLPDKNNKPQLQPQDLLAELNDEARFLSTDEVAFELINANPSVQLIDVRTPQEFEKYHLPGAINIPLADLLSPDWEETLNQDVKTNVLYSNGTIFASQAYIICRRLTYKNLYIMKGGLNEWFATIIKPAKPSDLTNDVDQQRYQTRLAASQFFTGGGSTVAPGAQSEDSANTGTTEVKTEKKKKAAGGTAGGC